MRQELATTVKATDPDGHFEAVGDPVTGATHVKIIGSVALSPDTLATSQANYVATTAGTGYSIGDQITATMWWDTTNIANPTFLIAAFYNWETALEITPNMAHLEQTGGDALTSTQLLAAGLATAAQIGEVQASPTANTVLDRLKTIGTYLAGVLTFKTHPLTSDTPSSVSSSVTTQTLIAANANRRSLTIFNNSTAILYVCHGATATQAGAKVPIGAGGFYEMPSPVYVGVLSGIWASANGNASIYEGV